MYIKNGIGSYSGNILHNAAAETIIYWISWCRNLNIIKNTLIAVRLQHYITSSQVTSITTLLEETLNIGEVSGKSFLRMKMVIFINIESLEFLPWILMKIHICKRTKVWCL